MPMIPRDRSPESSIALLRDPYGFIPERCRRHGSDLFEARLFLRRTICMTGREAAALFYDPDRFIRRGAPPGRVQKTLFGRGGVQGLDGEAHRHRKAMFMSLMTPGRIADLAGRTGDEWRRASRRWASRGRVVLYDEASEVLTRAVCAWAGLPLDESEVPKRTRELTALFDQGSLVGPGHWWARVNRKRANAWAGGIIDRVRAGRLDPPESSAAHIIARHRDPGGALLGRHEAAVELLNVLRPTVAIAVYVTFAALALHRHPGCRARLRAGEAGHDEWFVQEVRRFYPFFPAVAARVRHDFEWKGYRFPGGRLVMLDLHGTDHDARLWDDPEEFRPDRFRGREVGPFELIPQGGGDHFRDHRCAGEWITIELTKVAVDLLARRITYRVPGQDLQIERSRLPALPRSRFVIEEAREAG
ncbi:cytochrome P450 [Tautonia plasticadhaerens]|uniref:Fatty-acid peroxygenase n=1 Tax=Tautonia plasticadhaerens TaxID=2527974 RepID=A0A518H1E0_9BACT|nr:cytochrome P450 [Tautonia plasticadhaerens]QDV34648.1 Fatty-acid peroxygenase [Tautonia plasticadhaerens]